MIATIVNDNWIRSCSVNHYVHHCCQLIHHNIVTFAESLLLLLPTFVSLSYQVSNRRKQIVNHFFTFLHNHGPDFLCCQRFLRLCYLRHNCCDPCIIVHILRVGRITAVSWCLSPDLKSSHSSGLSLTIRSVTPYLQILLSFRTHTTSLFEYISLRWI